MEPQPSDPQEQTSNSAPAPEQIAPPVPAPILATEPAKPNRRRYPIIIAILLLVIIAGGVGLYIYLQPAKIQSSIRTYSTYTQSDIDALRAQSSSKTMSLDEVQKWDDQIYELVESHNTVDVDASKAYAYLAVAQMDAAALSFKAHGSFTGSLEHVSKDVLCELYPDSCSLLTAKEDPYSKTLSSIVVAKVKARIAADNTQTKPSVLKTGSQHWQGPDPKIGITAASFKPWFLTSADQFRSAKPLDQSSAEMQAELATVKTTLAAATNDQKAIVVRWAGGPGTRTPPGIWLTVATDYMQVHNTPFDSYLEVRALVTTSMADAVIGVFDSKYTYQYKRPNMFDTSIVTIMPTPNHPSYPAGHATISWAAATVLSAYLPDNKQEWDRLAKEASDSRTIGGIHFPADNVAGTTLGTDIGNQVLKAWKE
jgi:hypothetical protein